MTKRNSLLLLLTLLMFFSCENAPKEIVSENEPFFHTTDPSRLYFKNTRGHKYNSIPQRDTRIDYYYLKMMDEEQTIFPIIANNWLAEEAYILLKQSAQLPSDTLTIALTGKEKKDTLSLPFIARTEKYDFCRMLYTKSRSGYDIQLFSSQKEWIPIFKDDTEKNHFQEVMRDYFRLTEQI